MITDLSKANTVSDLRIQRETLEEPVSEFRDYKDYKLQLDIEIKSAAQSFVKIGYLMKVARDTDILRESGYRNLEEFAKGEYGITKDQLSRFIAINDRFSENGYSDRLISQYEGFGVAKLQEMLTLSDEVIAEISPSLTRREIQEIKAEIKQEEQITPVELAIEAAAPATVKEDTEYSYTQRIWKNYLHEHKDVYAAIACEYYPTCFASDVQEREAENKLLDAIAPNGDGVIFSRIPGVGKIMISISGDDRNLTYTNSRDGSKEKATITDAVIDIADVFGGLTPENWERVYGEPYEEIMPKPEPPKEEPKVAPVQQETKPEPGSINPGKGDTQKQAEETAKPEPVSVASVSEEKEPETEKEPAELTTGSDETDERQQPLKEYRTRPLNGCLDVGYNDRLVNTNTGEIAVVLGQIAGEIKVAGDNGNGSVFLVSAPNYNGWAVLEGENEQGETEPPKDEATGQQDTIQEETATGQQETAQDGATGQQDIETDEDGEPYEGIRGLRGRIYECEHEFEEVFEDAYADGFTVDGLKSCTRILHRLQVMINKLLDYRENSDEEEDTDDCKTD